MFEKEAEEYTVENVCSSCYFEKPCENKCEAFGCADSKTYVLKAFKDGAEFGYNKANEWHYMKDVNCYEDLPHNEDVYYAYVVNVGAYDKPTIERKLGCFAEFEFDVMAYHVIAWKEIVLPELPKESE